MVFGVALVALGEFTAVEYSVPLWLVAVLVGGSLVGVSAVFVLGRAISRKLQSKFGDRLKRG